MENKLLRIFSISFLIICAIFIVSLMIELYVYFTKGVAWIPVPYFLLILPTPAIGYIMMIIGEYFDNKKR